MGVAQRQPLVLGPSLPLLPPPQRPFLFYPVCRDKIQKPRLPNRPFTTNGYSKDSSGSPPANKVKKIESIYKT